ncbi:hypothetical protein ACH3XW_5970 [Acanthocheilonema viteae]
MDTTVSGSSTQLKQNDRLHPIHSTAELLKKRKKLLKERAIFAEEEGSMWEHSKAIFAQNIDDEENLKQSRRACKEISKQLQRNAKGLQLIDMRFKAASELIKTAMDTVEVTSKVSGLSIETFTDRFMALKICAGNDWEAMQEKLQQSAGIDDALVELQNSLNRLLRHKNLAERAERLRKMRDDREQLLRMQYEELLNNIAMLKSNLEMKKSTNQKLQQQFHEAKAELENILSADIENLDEVMAEEEELEQQLYACSQECDEAMTELSKLDERNGEIADKERVLDEKIIIMKTELENLIGNDRDDTEIISLQYKRIRENLQAKMNEKATALQDEIRRAQAELNCVENEHASLMILLDDGQHDWSKEIEDVIATRRHLEEMITAERKASAILRSKRMEIDIECNRLEMETNVLRESNNAEMAQYEVEISDLQKYLEKLIAEEKEEMQHYEMIRSRTASTACSTKHACFRDGEIDVRSLRSSAASDFGDPSSDNFKRSVVSRPQWLTTTNNATKTLFDKTDPENEVLSTAKKFEDERAVDSEGTGKVPSDIHVSRMDKADSKIGEVIKTDTNLRNYYPLPPSAFGSPLSTNDSPDVTTDREMSGSELDQSVWSDFSSVVK